MAINKNNVIEVLKNLILSFLSYALPTAVLQFVIQPVIANKLGAEINGQYLTLMSLVYFMMGVTSNVLNTVRMLQNEEYRRKGLQGDFNWFFCLYAALLILVMPLGHIYYTKSAEISDIVLYVIIGLLYLYHNYIFSQYKIEQKFNKILINNIITVFGYFAGLLIFLKTEKWYWVIILPYTLGAIYDYCNTDFIRETAKRTILFGSTSKKIAMLTFSSLLDSMTTYCDKLLLYPLLGGECVSIYSTASIVGKILIMVSSPLSTVMLSYLIKIDKLSFKFSKKIILIFILLILSLYGVCVLVGYPLTDYLYPSWADESQAYIPITVASSVFSLINSILNTVAIRYHKTSFQAMKSGVNLVLYLSISLTLLKKYSLLGFCIGSAISSFISMCITLVVVITTTTKEDIEVE